MPAPEDRGRTEALADSLKQKAVTEVASTEARIERGSAGASQFMISYVRPATRGAR